MTYQEVERIAAEICGDRLISVQFDGPEVQEKLREITGKLIRDMKNLLQQRL
jgi:hypothetical protein